MKNNFFEGQDYQKGTFKALTPDFYTPDYKRYIKEEEKIIKSIVRGSKRILEAGVGNGRLLPQIAPLVKNLVGIDIAARMLKEARKISKNYSNVLIKKMGIETVDMKFPQKYFDYSLCVWNTLGNVGDNEVRFLKKLSRVTKKGIIITVFHRGHITKRKKLYGALGVDITKIDTVNETFYTKSGLISKSYLTKDIKELAKKSNLKVKETKVLAGVILYAHLVPTL